MEAQFPDVRAMVAALKPSYPVYCLRPHVLQRSAHRNVKELAADIEAWAATWNENPTPFVWHKTAEQILERLAGYCTAINQPTP